MDTSIKRTRTPKKYLKWSFLLLPTCIKRTLIIKFHHPTCQTAEMGKIASNCNLQIFLFLHEKTTWRTCLISFILQYCFLFRFVCIELVSLICFVQVWVEIYVYGTVFDKEMNAKVNRHSLWGYSKCFHCSFEWHLTPHMTLSIEVCWEDTLY